jgi:hypothetical protein
MAKKPKAIEIKPDVKTTHIWWVVRTLGGGVTYTVHADSLTVTPDGTLIFGGQSGQIPGPIFVVGGAYEYCISVS